MDNSEEGIIIMKDSIMDYVNDKFIEQQHHAVKEAIIGNDNSI